MQNIKELINFGIINIDKPVGPTSFSVSSFVRNKLKLNKTSHLGTLDPKVSGVLPITLGRACRLAGFFIGHNKAYVGVLHCHKEQKIENLQKLIDKFFVGKIQQLPPNKSAVRRMLREREVYLFEILEADSNQKDFLFYCEVEGGTYIRKLCSDLGEMIGGAHMAELRRTKAGVFSEEKIYSLVEFEKAVKEYEEGKSESLREMIVDAGEAVKLIMPIVNVKEKAIRSLLTGKPLFLEDVVNVSDFSKIKKEGFFCLFSNEKFIGIYKKISESTLIATSEFVFN